MNAGDAASQLLRDRCAKPSAGVGSASAGASGSTTAGGSVPTLFCGQEACSGSATRDCLAAIRLRRQPSRSRPKNRLLFGHAQLIDYGAIAPRKLEPTALLDYCPVLKVAPEAYGRFSIGHGWPLLGGRGGARTSSRSCMSRPLQRRNEVTTAIHHGPIVVARRRRHHIL